MFRIWHQSVNELDELGVYKQALEAHAQDILGDEAQTVLDVFGVTWAYARMQLRLWHKTGLRVGRSWHHRRDDPALVAQVRQRS